MERLQIQHEVVGSRAGLRGRPHANLLVVGGTTLATSVGDTATVAAVRSTVFGGCQVEIKGEPAGTARRDQQVVGVIQFDGTLKQRRSAPHVGVNGLQYNRGSGAVIAVIFAPA